MAIAHERFKMALSRLDPTQWRLFERLANVFMSSEYSGFRPLASTSGDGGADGLLFAVEEDPSVVLQFSVRRDVRAKIMETCKRLKETYKRGKVLVYVTNQLVGAEATVLGREVREGYGLYLDVHDREWLLGRRNQSTANEAEAEALAQAIVDPLLGATETVERQAQALEDLEAKAAFVHLGLQWQDDTREKGLTKLCFEALVRSVLRDTTNEARLSRQQVRNLVSQLLPAHHPSALQQQVDGALGRLSKRYIRHWKKLDEFCLTWDERQRLATRVLEMAELHDILERELGTALHLSAAETGVEIDDRQFQELNAVARNVVERVLLDRGEAFASAVTRGAADYVRAEDVEVVVTAVLADRPQTLHDHARMLAATVQGLLLHPPDDVRQYLRGLADTYTLFAFMRETPDVQSAVVKMFSEGDFWLDTSVVLPLLAEDLLPEGQRAHAELLAATTECGLRLYVTPGVVEELATHVRRTSGYGRAAANAGAYGDPPFLYLAHQLAGRSPEFLDKWLEGFCGSDPESDLLDYLEEEHQIQIHPLAEFTDRADIAYRAAVAEVWHETRDARDRRVAALGLPTLDPATRQKLVDHDVENYVGVVQDQPQCR